MERSKVKSYGTSPQAAVAKQRWMCWSQTKPSQCPGAVAVPRAGGREKELWGATVGERGAYVTTPLSRVVRLSMKL